MAGGSADINLGALMFKRATVSGTVPRAWPIEEKIAVTQRFAAEVVPLFETERCAPSSTRATRWSRRATPTAAWRRNANVGKILLDVRRA